MANRLNVIGFLAVLVLLIGLIIYSTDGDRDTTVLAFLWVGFIFAFIQYVWNVFAFGTPVMGQSDKTESSLLDSHSATVDTDADVAALRAQVAALEADKKKLQRQAAAGGAAAGAVGGAAVAAAAAGGDDEKLQAENEQLKQELVVVNSRLTALSSEQDGAEKRFAEREDAYKSNIADLQAQIGELKGDTEARNQLVADAQKKLGTLKPYIGILIEDIPKREKREKNIKGVRIQTVKPNTPAADVGFRQGDIIEKMNLVEMNSSNDVMSALVKRKPGDVCSFIVNREGEVLNLVMDVGHKDLGKDEVGRIRRLASGVIEASDLEE